MGKVDYAHDAELMKALGHPVRLKIVHGLMSGYECNVSKMVDELRIPQSTVSQHLGVLKNAGVISFRKEGVQACYRVIDRRVCDIIDALEE